MKSRRRGSLGGKAEIAGMSLLCSFILSLTSLSPATACSRLIPPGFGGAAGLVDAQPDIGGQPGHGVVAGGRRELTASRQLGAPSGEQLLDLLGGRWYAQLRINRCPGPVDLIQRAFNDAAGEVVQLDLVPQLQELEINPQRGRAARSCRRLRIAQYPAKIGIGVTSCISHTGRPNQSRISSR